MNPQALQPKALGKESRGAWAEITSRKVQKTKACTPGKSRKTHKRKENIITDVGNL